MSKENKSKGVSPEGALYVVATPIGNMEDITARAARILGEVDVVAAEDTRRARTLLNRLGIKATLISFYSAKQKARTPGLIRRLIAGQSVALITASGAPGVSDPGHYLVAKAVEAGVRVIPVPGPSAAIAALMASGMNSYVFTFYGFLPPKGGKRRKSIGRVASAEHPVILYESPHRIRRTLEDLRNALGNRNIVLGREITKLHEEFIRTDMDGAIEHFQSVEPRGEFVLIVMGP